LGLCGSVLVSCFVVIIFLSCTSYLSVTDTFHTLFDILSLHGALPILSATAWEAPWAFSGRRRIPASRRSCRWPGWFIPKRLRNRSEEHTSELQSRENLVCRLLLEKKNRVAILN